MEAIWNLEKFQFSSNLFLCKKKKNSLNIFNSKSTIENLFPVVASCNTHILLENDNTNDKRSASVAPTDFQSRNLFFALQCVYQVFCLPLLRQIDGGLTFWLDITRYCQAYRDWSNQREKNVYFKYIDYFMLWKWIFKLKYGAKKYWFNFS